MTFSDPQKNIQQFGLIEGMKVADLGAGSGAYTIAAAGQVGNSGRVYAVEVQKELLSRIKNNADNAANQTPVSSEEKSVSTDSVRKVFRGATNVEVIWGDIELPGGTKIKDALLDAVIVSNVLFQAEDKKGLVEEVRRILKPKGRVLVVDWKESFMGMGPHPDHIVSEQFAKKLFEDGGFSLDRSISAGDHHYGFIATKER
ncbi:MAG: methyltransferase domain-containing protein [Candidatus Yonathbacteria bacterium]|nr:methyltransferase domain-containing protein [Candidatus Yonathbacteria bacterium]